MFLVNGQIVNISGFVGRVVTVTTTQLWSSWRARVVVDNM